MDRMKTHGTNGADKAAGPADQVGDDPQASESKGATRRRLLKGGLIGAPVILTQTGRPAWAGGCSESAMASENMSEIGSGECWGEGCNKKFWKNHTGLWHPNYHPDREFDSVFLVTAFYAENTQVGATLNEVIRGDCDAVPPVNCTGNCSRELRRLGRHAVAALQNAACDIKYDFDVLTVVNMFLEAYTDGSIDKMRTVRGLFEDYNEQYCPLDDPLTS